MLKSWEIITWTPETQFNSPVLEGTWKSFKLSWGGYLQSPQVKKWASRLKVMCSVAVIMLDFIFTIQLRSRQGPRLHQMRERSRWVHQTLQGPKPGTHLSTPESSSRIKTSENAKISLTNVDIFRNYESLQMSFAIRKVCLTCLYQMLVVMLWVFPSCQQKH